jgi:hypothetical protein
VSFAEQEPAQRSVHRWALIDERVAMDDGYVRESMMLALE